MWSCGARSKISAFGVFKAAPVMTYMSPELHPRFVVAYVGNGRTVRKYSLDSTSAPAMGEDVNF